MIYLLFLPLVLSARLAIHVYLIDPKERGNILFGIFSFCTILNVICLFIIATTDQFILAQAAHIVLYLVEFVAPSILLLLLAAELAFARTPRPQWVQSYITFCILFCLITGLFVLLGYTNTTTVLSGPLQTDELLGWIPSPGAVPFVPQVGRLLCMWGALGILARFWGQDRKKRAGLWLILLILLSMPILDLLVAILDISLEFTAARIALDLALTLACGFSVTQLFFIPVHIALHQTIESMTAGVIVLDPSGRVLRMNRAAEELLNVHHEKVLYGPYVRLFDSWRRQINDPQMLDQLLEKDISADQTLAQEFQLGPTHIHFHVNLQISLIREERDRVRGKLLILTNTTIMRDREESLEKSLDVQQELLSAANQITSPVLPVMERVIVLPVAGDMDTTRANLFMDTLLQGINNYHAKLALLDLTGVPMISFPAAAIFLQALNAARLLGSEPVLVGIQGRVAETLGSYIEDLDSWTIYADLQAGLQYAIQTQTTNDIETIA